MQRSGDFVNLYCKNCGYDEEMHYKEIERRSLRCPECGHFADYEEISDYADDLSKPELDWDDIDIY